MRKTVLATTFAALLAFSLVGCGGASSPEATSGEGTEEAALEDKSEEDPAAEYVEAGYVDQNGYLKI